MHGCMPCFKYPMHMACAHCAAHAAGYLIHEIILMAAEPAAQCCICMYMQQRSCLCSTLPCREVRGTLCWANPTAAIRVAVANVVRQTTPSPGTHTPVSATYLLLAEVAQIKGNSVKVDSGAVEITGSNRATILHKGAQGGGH
jgi:hypothetical protein